MEILTVSVNISEIDVIVFRPNDDEPGIFSSYADGRKRLCVFGDDAECNECWAALEKEFQNEDFICYNNIFFRVNGLKSLDKYEFPELHYYLHFVFHNDFEFRRRYEDKKMLDEDLNILNEILGTLQDIRASRHASPTKQ